MPRIPAGLLPGKNLLSRLFLITLHKIKILYFLLSNIVMNEQEQPSSTSSNIMMLPYNPLRQVKSDIIVEGVRKSLRPSVKVVLRAALEIEGV